MTKERAQEIASTFAAEYDITTDYADCETCGRDELLDAAETLLEAFKRIEELKVECNKWCSKALDVEKHPNVVLFRGERDDAQAQLKTERERFDWLCANTVFDIENRSPDEWRQEIDKARGEVARG
jgi:phosphopantothenoylcysteine synthetase/decarboxylase